MVYNLNTGKYGIQLKNPKRHDKYFGCKWDMGAAGHNCYIKDGDKFRYLNFHENLVKEVKEEIGLDLEVKVSLKRFLEEVKEEIQSPIGFVFEEFHHFTGIDNEWVGLAIILVVNEEINFNDGEVVDLKWITPE